MERTTSQRISRAISFVRSCCPTLVALAVAASVCTAAPNQFVILSDTHPARGAEPQLALLKQQLLRLRPAFVVQLGDFEGGGTLIGSAPGAESSMQLFHALREAGIDVYPVIGNHDQGQDKHQFICNHQPAFNPKLDPAINPAIYERWCGQRRRWYSFNRGGIHFVIVDFNLNPAYEKDVPGETRYGAQEAWLMRDLCDCENNPSRFPTFLFMHCVGYLGCDTRARPGPVYRVLQRCPDHTVVAAFGGHWHNGQGFPPESNLGVHSYATETSVHLVVSDPEYIIATVHPDRITFETVDTKTEGPGKTGLVYYPIPGKFTSLDDRSTGPAVE